MNHRRHQIDQPKQQRAQLSKQQEKDQKEQKSLSVNTGYVVQHYCERGERTTGEMTDVVVEAMILLNNFLFVNFLKSGNGAEFVPPRPARAVACRGLSDKTTGIRTRNFADSLLSPAPLSHVHPQWPGSIPGKARRCCYWRDDDSAH